MTNPWIPWMRRALQLAALGAGRTSPNPLVGAVVLDAEGTWVGEGYHARAGEPHAEVGALAQAGERARGGTLIVTLEPCCHQGRTPPCCEAVIAAGIERVVLALRDPNPRVNGGGIERLRAAGIAVIEGVAEAEAQRQNAAFLHRITTGRPLGILKWAMSLDGRTALPNGASHWISGPAARAWVHQLRAHCDAVIVGGGTLRADDPLLTSRGQRRPEPLRVVLSHGLDLPGSARLWDTSVAPTLVAHGPEAPLARRQAFDRLLPRTGRPMAASLQGAKAAAAAPGANGDPPAAPLVERTPAPGGMERLELTACEPRALLVALAERGCNQVLWECGPELAAAALRQGCVQQLAAVIAPKLLGGEPARTPLGPLGGQTLEDAWRLNGSQQRWLAQDLLWRSHVEPPGGWSDGGVSRG